MSKKILLLLLFFAVLFDLSGCASMSAQARRERAYRHYVQKQMKQRNRAMARAQKAAHRKMKSPVPSQPQITSGVENAPRSWSEPVAPPVTVSASDAIANQTDSQPAQP
ncbi:MAG TPA: hypothetical protein VNW72_14615 [Chthoniobacterales bacterium]|nr:hypothetical protein [Chthoniobacterales bacterium]